MRTWLSIAFILSIVSGCAAAGHDTPEDRGELPGAASTGGGSGTSGGSGTGGFGSGGGSGTGGGSGASGGSGTGGFGTAGGSATGGGSGTGGEGGGDAATPCRKGLIKANQVVMIGDSYFHITQVPAELWNHARAAGTLGASETYRFYYVSGAQMVGGGLIAPIPTQYVQAKAADPNIDTILISGGGNDVLIGDRSCLTQAPPANAQCLATINGVLAAFSTLLDEMAKDGVKHVVYSFYPHIPPMGLFQGYAPAANDTLDYVAPLVEQLCAKRATPTCTFVDPRTEFEGHAEYLNPGDVHASPAGSKVIADLIWEAMVEHCIAQ